MRKLARGARRTHFAILMAAAAAVVQPAAQALAEGFAGTARPPDLEQLGRGHAEEARRLAEKLERARQRRDARVAVKTPAPEPSAQAVLNVALLGGAQLGLTRAPRGEPAADQGAPLAPEPPEYAVQRLQDTRVTVLLRMAPGTYGIRRGNRSADPILCLPDGCYASEGVDTPARFLPGRRALGFRNTWGPRAHACRGALDCVFRDVDLGRLPGYLQPVDLHILRHDRRRGQLVRTDSGCALAGGRLVCHDGIIAEDYVMWIVPERMAAAAGPAALERALAEGLGLEAADLPQYGRP
jgi:hypothetical protein